LAKGNEIQKRPVFNSCCGKSIWTENFVLQPLACSLRFRTHVRRQSQKCNGIKIHTFRLLHPLCLQKLLDYYTPGQADITQTQAFGYAAAIVGLSFLFTIFNELMYLECCLLGMKLRVACSSLIYRKCLQMKKTTYQRVTTGKIVSLLSNDVYRLDYMFNHIHYMWMGPVKTIQCGFYLYYVFGYTALVGIGVVIVYFLVLRKFSCRFFLLLLPLKCIVVYLVKKKKATRRLMATKTDYRIRLMNDIVSGIKVIKTYTWEKPFSELVHNTRRFYIFFSFTANSLILIL
jgi:ATP-binding cassette subfamily C (CFTR/MRP) protein 4